MSKFSEVIAAANLGKNDEIAVTLYAHFLCNTWVGARPSDCARRAVREFNANPDRIRNRESGCAPKG